MARTKRVRGSYSAGEWGRNRVRVFPELLTRRANSQYGNGLCDPTIHNAPRSIPHSSPVGQQPRGLRRLITGVVDRGPLAGGRNRQPRLRNDGSFAHSLGEGRLHGVGGTPEKAPDTSWLEPYKDKSSYLAIRHGGMRGFSNT